MNITVSKAPKIVNAIDALNYPEDSNATITCTIASGELESLNFEWIRGDSQRISVNSRDPRFKVSVWPDNFQSILRIFNLRKEDEGYYTCQAKNRFGVDKLVTKLTVKGR